MKLAGTTGVRFPALEDKSFTGVFENDREISLTENESMLLYKSDEALLAPTKPCFCRLCVHFFNTARFFRAWVFQS